MNYYEALPGVNRLFFLSSSFQLEGFSTGISPNAAGERSHFSLPSCRGWLAGLQGLADDWQMALQPTLKHLLFSSKTIFLALGICTNLWHDLLYPFIRINPRGWLIFCHVSTASCFPFFVSSTWNSNFPWKNCIWPYPNGSPISSRTLRSSKFKDTQGFFSGSYDFTWVEIDRWGNTAPGPTPRVKPLDDDWLVAEKWRLSAAGAVARAEVEAETASETPYKALRVSELFEVREKDQQKRLGYATSNNLVGWMDGFGWDFLKNHLKIFCFFLV